VEEILYEHMDFPDPEFPISVLSHQGKPRFHLDLSYHMEMEFQFICLGHGAYFIRDTNYPLQSNTVLIIHPNEVHNWIVDADAYVRKFAIMFSPMVLRNMPIADTIQERLKDVHCLSLTSKQSAKAEILLSGIDDECRQRGQYWQSAVRHYLELFLILLNDALEVTSPHPGNVEPIVQEIIAYLEENYANPLSALEVADHFNLSRFTLSRKFRRYVGLGFHEYLMHRRIFEAKRLLHETDLKIIAIACNVGFDSISAFNRAFRLLTGVSPASFRRVSM
jgi:AraC-like DNA-binding protein